ncbi:hypothetical protein MML48_2g00022016 [Holotrichia oblita]|uniref:Uncharacterized protein n=1 Tax=Holotrichia oblita TaxID=644536 RepID=A0ACB9TLV8_HOLOL|nr:hypothetical protein MML48_2g00022016 [Holotrichia oblita]
MLRIVVRLGEYNLRTQKDCNDEEYCAPPHQDFEVSLSDITVHPQYNTKSLQNDIALIRLRKNVTITDILNPVCLPITIEEKNNHAKTYTVIGWGSPGAGMMIFILICFFFILEVIFLYFLGIRSDVLMKTNIPTKQIRKNVFPGQLHVVGVNETDPCRGDSGGPLMANYVRNRAFKIIQYGIVSMGPLPCAKENAPTTYTKVEAYLDWILDNLMS